MAQTKNKDRILRKGLDMLEKMIPEPHKCHAKRGRSQALSLGNFSLTLDHTVQVLKKDGLGRSAKISIDVENGAKPPIGVYVPINFCPFCGEKLKEA